MDRIVYIIGDVPVTLTQEEYEGNFSEDQVTSLEAGETIEWIDPDGQDHLVRLIS